MAGKGAKGLKGKRNGGSKGRFLPEKGLKRERATTIGGNVVVASLHTVLRKTFRL
jgi:hypothetical protein